MTHVVVPVVRDLLALVVQRSASGVAGLLVTDGALYVLKNNRPQYC